MSLGLSQPAEGAQPPIPLPVLDPWPVGPVASLPGIILSFHSSVDEFAIEVPRHNNRIALFEENVYRYLHIFYRSLP